jgi:hypothetical protein
VEGEDKVARWHEQRRRAIAEHGAALERQKAAETAQAKDLVAAFVREALDRGLHTTPLTARAYGRRARYRTGLRGWYVRADRSVAVGENGEYYVLSAPPSWRSRIAGARIAPGDPPLIVGEGGRDGESMPLRAVLQRRLDAGDDWPG